MKSIIRHIETWESDRIRVGIGKDVCIPVIGWVFGKIHREELKDYRQVVELTRDTTTYSCSHSFMDTMGHFNRKQGSTYGNPIKGASAERSGLKYSEEREHSG